MKRYAKILIPVAALAVGFVTLTGFGCHGSWGHGPWGHGELTEERAQKFATMMVDRVLDDVNATDQQRAQINAIKDQRVRDLVAFAQAHKATRQALLKEWESDKPDAKAIHALIDERIDALRKMAHQAADDALEVHDILTPEQRAKVTEHIKQHTEQAEEK